MAANLTSMNQKIALAVDLGGTNLRVAAVTEDGKIVTREEESTCHEGDSGEVVTEQIIRLLKKVQSKFYDGEIRGIGIGVPGSFDMEKGGIYASNVSEYFVPIVEPLTRELSFPVYVLNDASMAALGEQKFGAGKEIKNFVYVTISTGIGAGAIVNGELIQGLSKNVGKLGHEKIESEYDLPCTCGQGNNHWESYGSGKNIPRFFAAWGEKMGLSKEDTAVIDTPELFDKVKNQDKNAIAFMNELGKINAIGISNAIREYNPERIVLGGSVSLYHGDVLIKYFTPHLDSFSNRPEIVISSLGNDNALVGAATLVFEKQN